MVVVHVLFVLHGALWILILENITVKNRWQEMPQLRSKAIPRHQRERDEKLIMTKQTPEIKPPTNKQRGVASEEPS